jgi:hypothetical protein
MKKSAAKKTAKKAPPAFLKKGAEAKGKAGKKAPPFGKKKAK